MGQIRCIHQPFQHFVERGEKGVENLVNGNRQVDLINLLPLAFYKSLISFKCLWWLPPGYVHADLSFEKLVYFSVSSFSYIFYLTFFCRALLSSLVYLSLLSTLAAQSQMTLCTYG